MQNSIFSFYFSTMIGIPGLTVFSHLDGLKHWEQLFLKTKIVFCPNLSLGNFYGLNWPVNAASKIHMHFWT